MKMFVNGKLTSKKLMDLWHVFLMCIYAKSFYHSWKKIFRVIPLVFRIVLATPFCISTMYIMNYPIIHSLQFRVSSATPEYGTMVLIIHWLQEFALLYVVIVDDSKREVEFTVMALATGRYSL